MDKYERMLMVARVTPFQEVCGFVVKLRDEIKAPGGNPEFLIPVPNVHESPEHNFAMDHRFQNSVLNNPKIVVTGMYHSHNHGDSRPSRADYLSRPNWPGTEKWDYFIIHKGQMIWNWKFIKDGEIVGSRVA